MAKAKAMTKAQLASHLASRTGLTKKDTGAVLAELAAVGDVQVNGSHGERPRGDHPVAKNSALWGRCQFLPWAAAARACCLSAR